MMNEAVKEEVKEETKRKPGRPRFSAEDRAELERFRREDQERREAAEIAEREARVIDRREKELKAKQEETKTYINVSRGRVYTGVESLMVDGKKVKTMGVLYPRDWVGDVLPRHGAKKMELTHAQAAGFGEKLVAVE